MAEPLQIDNGTSVERDNRYQVRDFSFPNDLFADQRYGGNYVVFYINANSDSKLVRTIQEGGGSGASFIEGVERIRSEFIEQQEANNATRTGLAAQNATLTGAGAILANQLGIGSGTSAAGFALGSTGGALVAGMAGSATREQKRLSTAIAMHVPNQLQIRYSMQWTEDDTFAMSAIGEIGNDVWDALSALANNGNFSETGSDALGTAGGVGAATMLRSGPNSGALSSATGLAANPKKEQVFKGINFRDFTFDYQFFPRDEQEARNVQNIIHQFKYHMHPEFKDGSSFLYIYPSEFDISYFMNGRENPNLHKHTSCVLTDMNINYTPNGVYTTFDDGQPTQINMTLTFRELALVTKEKIGMEWGDSL